MKKTIVFILSLGLLLTACAPKPGANVSIKNENAIGCRVFVTYAGEWTKCLPLPIYTQGVVTNHPELGHDFAGRVRVTLEGYGTYWMLVEDLEAIK